VCVREKEREREGEIGRDEYGEREGGRERERYREKVECHLRFVHS